MLLFCAGGGLVTYFAFVHEIEEPVTDEDRALAITAERLAELSPDLAFDRSRGKLRKVRHLDGSRELEYEYESPDDAGQTLYVSFAAGVERTAQDARNSYAGERIGAKIGLRVSGEGRVREVERGDLWRWGDESRCSLLKSNGVVVGNLFMARKGRRLFLLMIVGVCFEDAAPIRELLDPMLERLEKWGG